MNYSSRFPNLKSQLFSFLYNLLLKGELQVLKPEDVKNREVLNADGLIQRQDPQRLTDLNERVDMAGVGLRHRGTLERRRPSTNTRESQAFSDDECIMSVDQRTEMTMT